MIHSIFALTCVPCASHSLTMPVLLLASVVIGILYGVMIFKGNTELLIAVTVFFIVGFILLNSNADVFAQISDPLDPRSCMCDKSLLSSIADERFGLGHIVTFSPIAAGLIYLGLHTRQRSTSQ